MSDMKIPVTFKVMFVGAVLMGGLGAFFGDGWYSAVAVIVLVILSCAVSILEGQHEGFKELDRVTSKNKEGK